MPRNIHPAKHAPLSHSLAPLPRQLFQCGSIGPAWWSQVDLHHIGDTGRPIAIQEFKSSEA